METRGLEVRVGMLVARPMLLYLATLLVAVAVGCAPSSQLARPSNPPADPYALGSAPAGRLAAAGQPGFAPTAPGGGKNNNVAQPTGRAMNAGQAGGAEVVATPQPDNSGLGPAVAPNYPPAAARQRPVAVRPSKRVSWWRGFLPAHGTNEDRPGWWTPDYGGGTSD